jgi:GMP synthase-like glutamine amidotransferase
MRVLSIVHHRNAAAGVFDAPAQVAGHELVEWIPHEGAPPAVDEFDAAMVFGAEAQVDQEEILPWLGPEKELVRALLERKTPTLGVCFGSQLLAEACGAVVRPAERAEIGWNEIELTPEGRDDPLLGFLPERFEGFGYHHYEWLLPPGAVELARSAACLQAFRLADRPVWGLQFHPEVTLPDLSSWLDGWQTDPGALATGLDPEAIRDESTTKIAGWNEVGREISARFLAAAAGTLLER